MLLPHDELIIDNFAGGGGASTGIEMALGRSVDHAINHDRLALAMHRINHPQTVHHCEDVFDMDPLKLTEGRPVGLGWFSPDCKHFSKAKGGQPLDKKIRGLMLVILRWAAIRTRVITMENVEEIETWGPLLSNGKPDPKHKGRTWRAFLAALGPGLPADHPDIPEMLAVLNGNKDITPITRAQLVRGFGYDVERRILRACDYGAPTIRKRLFLIARCDGRPIVWPEATHVDPKGSTRAPRVAGCAPAASSELFREGAEPGPRGRGRSPAASSELFREGAEPSPRGRGRSPWRPVAECIDWQLPCPSIFLTKAQARKSRCKRPLAQATLRRVATGIGRYVIHAAEPFLVSLTHQGGERIEPVSEPARTLTGAHRGEKALVSPLIAREFGQSVGQSVNTPAPTVMPHGQGKSALVETQLAPFLTEHANASAQRTFPADEPLRTQCGEVKGGHFAVVAPVLARTAHGDVDSKGKKRGRGAHPVTEPLPSTLASSDLAVVAAHLTKFNTGSVGSPMTAPAPTIVAGTHSPDTHGGAASTLGVVAANLVKLRGDAETHAPGAPASEPAHTISAGGEHHALSCAYLAQHNGGFNTTPGHPVDEPLSTISAKGSQQQIVAASITAYYGNDKEGQSLHDPARTVTTKERLGLVESQAVGRAAPRAPGHESPAADGAPALPLPTTLTPSQLLGARRVAKFLRRFGVAFEGEFATVAGYVIVDIGMRMLTPRELFRAQGFADAYVIDRAWVVDPQSGAVVDVRLTKEQQIRMCGNSVSPPQAAAIVAANVPELATWHRGDAGRFGRVEKVRASCLV